MTDTQKEIPWVFKSMGFNYAPFHDWADCLTFQNDETQIMLIDANTLKAPTNETLMYAMRWHDHIANEWFQFGTLEETVQMILDIWRDCECETSGQYSAQEYLSEIA